MNTALRITIVAVAVVAVLAVLGVGFAFAQSTSPWGGRYGMMGGQGMMNGQGMMGGGMGMMGNGNGMTLAPARSAGVGNMGAMAGVDLNAMHTWMATTGGMHGLVWGGLADALDLTQDDLNARFAAGETLAQIAEAQGVTQADLAAALQAAVKARLDQAVADGTLTREQADQMLSHMAGNYELMLTQMGANNCHRAVTGQGNS